MIVVFGSINLDLVVAVARLPEPGETVSGPDHQFFAGGKGANQALSACRAGAEVAMVGAVGDDPFAEPALANMRDAGVRLDRVRRLSGATGLALIGIDAAGENQIIVASGANGRVEGDWLRDLIGPSDVLMLQGEAPYPEALKAMEIAKTAGASIFWNPAPVPSGDLSAGLKLADVLVVNEAEGSQISAAIGGAGKPEDLLDHEDLSEKLVVVTLGAAGVVARFEDERIGITSPPVNAVDTTGAGDAFCGALVAALSRQVPVPRALAEAVSAGALACTVAGAQSSAPTRAQIEEMADSLS